MLLPVQARLLHRPCLAPPPASAIIAPSWVVCAWVREEVALGEPVQGLWDIASGSIRRRRWRCGWKTSVE